MRVSNLGLGMATKSLRPAYCRQKTLRGRLSTTIFALWAALCSWFQKPANGAKSMTEKLRAKVLGFEGEEAAHHTSLRAQLMERRMLAQQSPFLSDTRGIIEMSGIMTTVGLIVGAILGFALLAAFAGTWFDFTGEDRKSVV